MARSDNNPDSRHASGAPRSALAVALVVFLVAPVSAQPAGGARREADSFIQQQRLIDERLRQEHAEIAPLDALLDWQWGGWIDYYLAHIDDGIQQSRVFQRPGLSLWTRISADGGAHEAFARVRLEFHYFNDGDQYRRRQDVQGPNFDRAWYQIDLGRAFRLTEPGDPYQLKIRIGRQEVQFGSGFVLDMPLDAVLLDAKLRDFRVRGLLAKTIASYPNVDRSPAVADHSGRNMFGVQASYEGFRNHVPYVYALWNQDHTDERPREFLQEYSYDTQYFGIGARGSLVHNLNYRAEFVYESGHSFGHGNFLRRDYVEAYGWDIGLEYLFDTPTKPRVAVDYLFASGDSDRYGSPTSARGGNRIGRKDTSFVAFGYRDTGITAAPMISNIHIWRAAFSFTPFDGSELFRDFELGTNWFLYHKNRRGAALSDPTAGRGSGYAGWEMDYFLNWRLASDIALTVRWGVFFPGDAFRDRSTRHTVFSGLTWSF